MGIDTRVKFFKKENNKYIPILNKKSETEDYIDEKYFDYLNEDTVRMETERLLFHTGLKEKKLLINNDIYYSLKKLNLSKNEEKEILSIGEKYYGETMENLIKETIKDRKEYVKWMKKERNLFITEFYSREQNSPSNIKKAVNDKYEIATNDNTPEELNINYTYNAYNLPLIINLETLINSESIQYGKKEKQYSHLLEELSREYPEIKDKEELKKYYTVIEFF